MRSFVLALCAVSFVASAARAQSIEAPDDVVVSSHALDVSLEGGVAAVHERLALRRAGTRRAEVLVRVPLPSGATVVSVRVCRARRCRRLVEHTRGGQDEGYTFSLYLPGRGVTHAPIAASATEARAISVRVAPVDGIPTSIALRWSAPLSVHEGRASIEIPAWDTDARLAPAAVTVSASDLDAPSVGGAGTTASVAPGTPIAIEGQVTRAIARLDTRGGMARAFVVSPRVVIAHDVVIAVDLSPSMAEVPAERIAEALVGTLAALPPDARVRVLRFGARAEWATPDGAMPPWRAPTEIDAQRVLDVRIGALGSRTLYAPVAARIDEALDDALSPLVIVLGDGALVAPDFAPVEREGGRVVVVDVGDDPFTPEVDAASRAAPRTLALQWSGSSSSARGGPAIASVVAEPAAAITLRDETAARTVLVPSGEPATADLGARASLSALGAEVLAARAPWSILPRALASRAVAVDPRVWGDVAKFEGGGPAPRHVPGGLGGVDDAITGAPYLPPPGSDGAFVPHRAVRVPLIRAAQVQVRSVASTRALRRAVVQSLRPRIRGCFADARHGRWWWWARASVRLVLGHREVLAGNVSGANVDASLAACIERGFEHIQVPPMDEIVIVHMPFVADPIARPARAPLAPEVDATLTALFGEVDRAAMEDETWRLLGAGDPAPSDPATSDAEPAP